MSTQVSPKGQLTKSVFELLVPLGTSVRLIGSHPHAGKCGTFAGLEEIGLFRRLRPRVDFADGTSCHVMSPDQWEPVLIGEVKA